MASIWDDEQIQPTGGDFVKFNEVGDTVIGTITAIRKQRFADDEAADGFSYAPQIDLDTADGERTLTAGAVKLRQLFIDQRPEVGDRIKVVHTGKNGRVKLFTLEVKRAAQAEPARTRKALAEPVDDTDIPF